jgi:AcrR family transcriptional regulator
MTRKEREQLARRQYILDAASTVFARDGYENASMNEIAKLSEFSKRTLYQYFEDKADLYLTVLLQLYSKMCDDLSNVDYESKTGYDMIREKLYNQYDYYKSHTDTFRILYDIGKVRTLTSNLKIDQFLELDSKVTADIVKAITLGQNDGSISKKSDPLTTSMNLKFITSAVFDKLTTTSETYAKHINKSVDDFAHELLNLILSTLKD